MLKTFRIQNWGKYKETYCMYVYSKWKSGSLKVWKHHKISLIYLQLLPYSAKHTNQLKIKVSSLFQTKHLWMFSVCVIYFKFVLVWWTDCTLRCEWNIVVYILLQVEVQHIWTLSTWTCVFWRSVCHSRIWICVSWKMKWSNVGIPTSTWAQKRR